MKKIIAWLGVPLVCVFLSLLISVVFTGLNSTSADIQPSDAIVSLAPGESRLPTALEFKRDGIADELAVSWHGKSAVAPSRLSAISQLELELCRTERVKNIVCFVPQPDSTFGEAVTVKELAQLNDWYSITVVTSSYHVFRSNYIFQQCLPGVSVQVVAAPTDLNLWQWVYHIAYENASFVKALIDVSAECL
jgi:uncharacterized SAM-binding protein YcdF (DUF218 family)